MKRLGELERLRGLAAIMIVVAHVREVNPFVGHRLLGDPWAAVDLFFVLSGFVITGALVEALPPDGDASAARALRVFYGRRLWRIAPLALVWAALPVALSLVCHASGILGPPARLAREPVAIATLTYNYAIARGAPSLLAPYWSLTVEEHFYLVYPLLLIAARTRRARLILVLALIVLVAAVVRPLTSHGTPLMLFVSTHRRADALLAGGALWLITDGRPALRAVPRPLGQVLVAALLAALWIAPHLGSFSYNAGPGFVVLWALGAALVLLAAQDRGYVFGQGALARALEHVGARSYGLYLAHFPIAWALAEVDARVRALRGGRSLPSFVSPLPRAALYVAVLLTVTELLYRYVESPLRRHGRERARALGEGSRPPRLGSTARLGIGAGLVATAALVAIAWTPSQSRAPELPPARVLVTAPAPRREPVMIELVDPPAVATLHWGVTIEGRAWQIPAAGGVPHGSTQFPDGSMETPFIEDAPGHAVTRVGPFGDEVDALTFVIHYGGDRWQSDHVDGKSQAFFVHLGPKF